MKTESRFHYEEGWEHVGGRYSCFVDDVPGLPYSTVRVFFWPDGGGLEFCPWGEGEAFYSGNEIPPPDYIQEAIKLILPPLPA